MNRKKPGVAFWATVVVVAVVLYVGSFGPACWMTAWRAEKRKCPFSMIVYWPLSRTFFAVNHGWDTPAKTKMRRALYWWITVGLPADKDAIVLTGPNLTEIAFVCPRGYEPKP